MEQVELEVTYHDRDYQVELRRVSLQGFSQKEELLLDPGGRRIFRGGLHAGCDRAECIYQGE